MQPWADKTSVKKGAIGEAVVDEYLRSLGLVPYSPVADGAHPFDRLCATSDKRRLFIAEVKSKARRTFYPDTGINRSHFDGYIEVIERHSIPVWLLFADESEGRIYGGDLRRLCEEMQICHNGRILRYPWHDRGIVYFPLCKMTHVTQLSAETAIALRALSRRNYDYAD